MFRKDPFLPKQDGAVSVRLSGKRVFLPAYVPFIGPRYFAHRPRVLCYAINQNLSLHRRWTDDWLKRWGSDLDAARDRLNHAASGGRPIPIKPYTEGFIPVVALMALQRWRHNGAALPSCVDDVIAVTNFVKFSTHSDASSSSIPLSWWRECGGQYVKHELSVLRPDIVLAFGQRTLAEIRRVLADHRPLDYEPELLRCRFPARIPSNKGRPLSLEEERIWGKEFLPLLDRTRSPDSGYCHKWRAPDYAGYFVDVAASWDAV